MIRITIEAAFETGKGVHLDGISDAIRDALEALRGEGAARVIEALNTEENLDSFMRESDGLTDCEVTGTLTLVLDA